MSPVDDEPDGGGADEEEDKGGAVPSLTEASKIVGSPVVGAEDAADAETWSRC